MRLPCSKIHLYYLVMIKIGLLSDTHGIVDEKLLKFFKDCDEIWHAGDMGNQVVSSLEELATFRGVYGNIDGNDVRVVYPKHNRFVCENIDVWITHIGGYPGRYDRSVMPDIFNNPPRLFISGHSHILKVMNDKKLGLLHMNPGAAGKSGMHRVRTAIRFVIDKSDIRDLEVLEIQR